MHGMTSLLESPAVRESVHRVSVADYHRLGELGVLTQDVELLRGLIVDKMPESPLRELVAQKLMQALLAAIPDGFVVRPERPLTLHDSEPEPDISVVHGEPDDWIFAHPTTASLVVEVAISSTAIDEQKAAVYAGAGIPEYWIVRPHVRVVDVYRQPTQDGYLSRTTKSENESLQCAAITGVEFPVAAILAKRT